MKPLVNQVAQTLSFVHPVSVVAILPKKIERCQENERNSIQDITIPLGVFGMSVNKPFRAHVYTLEHKTQRNIGSAVEAKGFKDGD
jgi:hypothetical protein